MRLGDLDALIENHFSDEHKIALSYANKVWMRKIISEAPTIDAVPVVRCKDCNEGELVGKTPSGCEHIFCHIHKEWVTADYFCGSGERKDGEG